MLLKLFCNSSPMENNGKSCFHPLKMATGLNICRTYQSYNGYKSCKIYFLGSKQCLVFTKMLYNNDQTIKTLTREQKFCAELVCKCPNHSSMSKVTLGPRRKQHRRGGALSCPGIILENLTCTSTKTLCTPQPSGPTGPEQAGYILLNHQPATPQAGFTMDLPVPFEKGPR